MPCGQHLNLWGLSGHHAAKGSIPFDSLFGSTGQPPPLSGVSPNLFRSLAWSARPDRLVKGNGSRRPVSCSSLARGERAGYRAVRRLVRYSQADYEPEVELLIQSELFLARARPRPLHGHFHGWWVLAFRRIRQTNRGFCLRAPGTVGAHHRHLLRGWSVCRPTAPAVLPHGTTVCDSAPPEPNLHFLSLTPLRHPEPSPEINSGSASSGLLSDVDREH